MRTQVTIEKGVVTRVVSSDLNFARAMCGARATVGKITPQTVLPPDALKAANSAAVMAKEGAAMEKLMSDMLTGADARRDA